jgi:phytoene dehydrogenase-like protein
MTNDECCDVVVIGAGHNGLVCANYLARAGLKTLVVEARPIIGGVCTSEELIPGATFSSCAFIQMMFQSEIVADLELAKFGLRSVAPKMQEMAIWEDGDHVFLWQEIDRTLKSIERHNKPDGANFMRFATRLKRFGNLTGYMHLSDPPTLEQLRKVFDDAGESELFEEFILLSAEELLERYIESDRLRGLMMYMGMVSTWGGPRTPGTAYVYGYHAQGEFEGHFGRYGLPEGGMGAISLALQNGLEAHGGAVRTGAPVRQVLIDGGVAEGVVLESGEVIPAKIVVSNADPIRSLVGLLPDGALSPEVREAASGISTRGSMARIHLLIDQLPDYVGFPAGEQGPQHEGLVILGPTPALYEKAWQAQQRGEFPDDHVIEALIPSVTHPGLCKPGLHTLTLGVQQLPFELADGNWDSRKTEWADLAMEIYFRYAPNIREHTLGRHVITPLDLDREYYISGGNIFHMSMVGTENLFSNRPIPAASGYRTLVANYYLCGSGSHPGGGVSGAPGHNAARRILADLAGEHNVSVTRAKKVHIQDALIDSLLNTKTGQKIGYQIARSRVFRALSERLNRTGDS